MDNKFLIAFLSIFAVIGLSVSVIYIAKWISEVVIKRSIQSKEKQAVIDHKFEELNSSIEGFVMKQSEIEQYMENRLQRIEYMLGIDLKDMDFARIRKIEKRLDEMAHDIAKQIVRIDELEGRLNG